MHAQVRDRQRQDEGDGVQRGGAHVHAAGGRSARRYAFAYAGLCISECPRAWRYAFAYAGLCISECARRAALRARALGVPHAQRVHVRCSAPPDRALTRVCVRGVRVAVCIRVRGRMHIRMRPRARGGMHSRMRAYDHPNAAARRSSGSRAPPRSSARGARGALAPGAASGCTQRARADMHSPYGPPGCAYAYPLARAPICIPRMGRPVRHNMRIPVRARRYAFPVWGMRISECDRYARRTFDVLREFSPPEISRVPLDAVLLQVRRAHADLHSRMWPHASRAWRYAFAHVVMCIW